MGKTKQNGIDASNKRHKKHKKHKHKKDEDELSGLSDLDESSVLSPPAQSLKLKIKIGGQTVGTKSYTVASELALDDSNSANLSFSQDQEEEIDVQSTPKIRLPKKDDEDTSDEERQWLNALEAGELDENGDVKKSKASSLLTTRQRALLHGERIEELMELQTTLYRSTELTEEQINRRQSRALRRRELAIEKTEKDKKDTVERLLKKQDSKLKANKPQSAKDRKNQTPSYKYINCASAIEILVPSGFQFPLAQQTAPVPKPTEKCCIEGCNNSKKYSCSKTNRPLCSLACYRKNLSSELLVST